MVLFACCGGLELPLALFLHCLLWAWGLWSHILQEILPSRNFLCLRYLLSLWGQTFLPYLALNSLPNSLQLSWHASVVDWASLFIGGHLSPIDGPLVTRSLLSWKSSFPLGLEGMLLRQRPEKCTTFCWTTKSTPVPPWQNGSRAWTRLLWLLGKNGVRHAQEFIEWQEKLKCKAFTIKSSIACCPVPQTIRIKESEWCKFCDESDMIVHFLFRCAIVQPFWRAICHWFSREDDLYLEIIPSEYVLACRARPNLPLCWTLSPSLWILYLQAKAIPWCGARYLAVAVGVPS